MNCPICKRTVPPTPPGEKSSAPFCSERCRLIDLGRWLSDAYVIPVSDDDREDGDIVRDDEPRMK